MGVEHLKGFVTSAGTKLNVLSLSFNKSINGN